VFEWLAYSKRPLKLHELLSGLGLDPSIASVSEPKAVSARILILCKPIVEISKAGMVDFVHFSVKE